jgi:hypothetical protein
VVGVVIVPGKYQVYMGTARDTDTQLVSTRGNPETDA